jgi:PhnB protein
MTSTAAPLRPSITPWLTVPAGSNAIDFYKSAFGANEVYRHEASGGGVVARLSVQGAELWVSEDRVSEEMTSEEPPERSESIPQPLGGNSVRMILTVADPDAIFACALAAGAFEVFPVGEDHGWRLGRLADPFGLHWEIGHPLE